MVGVDTAGIELVTVNGTHGGLGDPHDVVGDSGAGEVIVASLLAAVDQCWSLLLPSSFFPVFSRGPPPSTLPT